jgi:hypothetical protein
MTTAHPIVDMTDLPPPVRAAVDNARAKPLSYGVRLLDAPDGRPLVVLGEAHLKLARAQAIGRAVVDAFALRGVETFPRRRVLLGRVLGVLIEVPRRLLRLLSLGAIRDSTIRDARLAPHGTTVGLEDVSTIPLSLHIGSAYLALFFAVTFTLLPALWLGAYVPNLILWGLLWLAMLFQWHMLALVPALFLRRFAWSWLLHPMSAILTARDRSMAEGTVTMLRAHPSPEPALVIMGRAHLRGYCRELVAKYGFVARE